MLSTLLLAAAVAGYAHPDQLVDTAWVAAQKQKAATSGSPCQQNRSHRLLVWLLVLFLLFALLV